MSSLCCKFLFFSYGQKRRTGIGKGHVPQVPRVSVNVISVNVRIRCESYSFGSDLGLRLGPAF